MQVTARVLGGLFGLAAGVALAQGAVPAAQGVSASTFTTDLMQLYREARLQDPRILASRARAQAGQEYQREAMGTLLPQVSLNAGVNRIHQENELVQQSFDSEVYSLVLRQYLYNKSTWENYQKFKSMPNSPIPKPWRLSPRPRWSWPGGTSRYWPPKMNSS